MTTIHPIRYISIYDPRAICDDSPNNIIYFGNYLLYRPSYQRQKMSDGYYYDDVVLVDLSASYVDLNKFYDDLEVHNIHIDNVSHILYNIYEPHATEGKWLDLLKGAIVRKHINIPSTNGYKLSALVYDEVNKTVILTCNDYYVNQIYIQIDLPTFEYHRIDSLPVLGLLTTSYTFSYRYGTDQDVYELITPANCAEVNEEDIQCEICKTTNTCLNSSPPDYITKYIMTSKMRHIVTVSNYPDFTGFVNCVNGSKSDNPDDIQHAFKYYVRMYKLWSKLFRTSYYDLTRTSKSNLDGALNSYATLQMWDRLEPPEIIMQRCPYLVLDY